MVGKQLADFGITTPQRLEELSSDKIRELSYDTAALEAQVVETELQLLTEQKGNVFENCESYRVWTRRSLFLGCARWHRQDIPVELAACTRTEILHLLE